MSVSLIAALPPTRELIIARYRTVRAEIEQIFLDAAHWNSMNHGAESIDPDPFGSLKSIADAIDSMLAQEAAR